MLLGGLFILVVAIYGALSLAVDIQQQTQCRAALRGDNRVVTGWKEQLAGGGRGGDEKLKYSFAVDGATYSGESRVPLKHLYDIAHSNLVQIRYLITSPSLNHPADWEWSPEWGQIFPMLLAFLMAGALLTAVLLERQLVANGIPVEASITDCSPNGKGGFRVKYTFRVEDGTEIQGVGWSASEQSTGDKICVLYLPSKPKRNQSYPGQLVHVAG